MEALVVGAGRSAVGAIRDAVRDATAADNDIVVVGQTREEKPMPLKQLLSSPLLARMVPKDLRRQKRNATKQLPGGTGSSHKQNRRKALKLSARRKQRGLHRR